MITEIRLDTVDSTNEYAKREENTFAADAITCVTAEEQTAGRGRRQRKWLSPRGVNLLATFYFRLPLHALHLTSIGLVFTFSLASLLLREGLHPKVKWPNDVQLNGKKVAGVLSEIVFQKTFAALFIGVGVNLNMELSDLAKIDQPATSLKIETGKSWDKWDVLKKLQAQFSSDLQQFQTKGFTPFHHPLENLLAYKGQVVKYSDEQREWEGICHSLTNDGQLNLFLPNKEMHTILSGEMINPESRQASDEGAL